MMRIPKSACSDLVLVSKEDTVQKAVEIMGERRIGSLLIIEDDKIAGVFTERDLMMKVVLRNLDPKKTPLEEVMTRDVKTVSSDASLLEVLGLMDRLHIRHVPVLKDGKPECILTMRNLQRLVLEQLRQENKTLAALLVMDGPGG